MSSPVLRQKHSLIGKSLIPVIMRVKAVEEDIDNYARLKKDHALENYSTNELHSEFEKLTGETMKDIIPLTGKDDNIHTARLLVHFSVKQANIVGGPKGQTLVQAQGNSATTSQQEVQGAGSSQRSQSASVGPASSGHSADAERQKQCNLDERLANIESNLQDISSKKQELQDLFIEQSKRSKFLPDVPSWEVNTGFCAVLKSARACRETVWVNYRGEAQEPFTHVTAEEVACGAEFDINTLPFRDPNNFIAGNLHNHFAEWSRLNPPPLVLDWIKEGVKVENFFRPFKGNFKGRAYHSDIPPPMYFPNALNCSGFGSFVAHTLQERIRNGSVSVLGKVGECQPPHLVLPLTVEPSKPRLCHDERFLNLWVKDCPFQLDTLREVPRLVHRDSFLASLDDKSGYDHILLHPDSRTYFGIQFAGWFMVFNVIPFGFKASAYVYHTTGLVPISYCRQLGVPCLLYIDDRLVSEFLEKGKCLRSGNELSAYSSLYIVCQILVRIGYFLNLPKCIFIPTQVIRFLGMMIDSLRLAFILPEDKRVKFAQLRDLILSQERVSVKTLQRFAGKCISFFLAVPSAKLFSKEVNRAIGLASKNSGLVEVSGGLREEIGYWKFLDHWSGCASWRDEKHYQVALASDASEYKWGALLLGKESGEGVGDFWDEKDHRPIHLKEAGALLNALNSYKHIIGNHRVDAYVDNLSLLNAWEGQKGKDPALNDLMKKLFSLTEEYNFSLKLFYVPSSENPADSVSRSISLADSTLCYEKWLLVEEKFGPHSVDLMALDSNAMLGRGNLPLRHFTPFPSPGTAGVNVFSQDVTKEENPYVFPPFVLILPVLKLLSDQGVEACTVLVPDFPNKPVWWPFLWAHVVDYFYVAVKGEKGVIKYPTKCGFRLDTEGVRWGLIAARLKFRFSN